MADSPQFTNYQINATTLNIMKEASGNYMPDYGHWRMRFGEGDIPDRDPEPEPQPEPTVDTDITINRGEDELWKKRWIEGEEGTEVGEVLTESEAYQSEAKMGDEEWEEFLANESEADKHARYRREVERGVRAAPTEGTAGYWEWYKVKDATPGSYTVSADAAVGDLEAHEHKSGLLKRTPYKQANEPNIPQAVGPGGFQPRDPEDINILKSARKAQTDRQSLSSTHIHDQGTQVMKDLKANLWNVGEDDNTRKKNRNKAHVIMQQLSHGAQGLLGPNSAIAQFGKSIDENLISDGFRHSKIMAKILHAGPDVKLGITPENTFVFQVPTGEINPDTGEPAYMALGKSDIEDLHERSIIQYPFGKQVRTGLDAVAADGRAGKHFNEDKIRSATRQMFKNLGSHGLASVMGDRGIFPTPGDQPLMSLALEGMEADPASAFTSKAQDIDHWDLIYEATQTSEGEQNLMEIGIDGIVEMARREYKPNYEEFLANNKPKNPTADMSVEQKVKFYKGRFA